MFKRLFLLLLLVLISGVSRAAGDWEAWLYEPATSRMILVNQAGTILEDFNLSFPSGYDYNIHSQVSVAPDGNFMAYIAGKSGTNDQVLAIYNHEAGGIVGTYPPPDVSYTGTPMFNQDSTLLALGNSTNADTWEIVVIDLSSLSISSLLTSSDPAASGIEANAFLTPYIQSFNADNVAFAQVRSATEGSLFYDNYVWNTGSNTVRASIGYGQIGADIYPLTGETVIALYDDRLPGNPDPYPFGYANTLNVYDPTSKVRFPFYNEPVTSLGTGYFVKNGEFILTSEYDGTGTTWFFVNREGERMENLPAVQIDSIKGTQDGFIYTTTETGTPELRHVDQTGEGTGLGNVLFTGSSDSYLRIEWVGLRGSDGILTMGSFPAWNRLEETTTETGGAVVNEPSTDDDRLRVGGQATVNTTEGDSLNVRSAAGTEFQIRGKLRRGTVVTLMEGPVDADGFTWWLVRTPDGLEGWAVDFADNEVTLVPGTSTRTTTSSGGQVDETTEGADPTIPSLLAVGDNAVVTLTSARDVLRLRNAPSTDARIVMLMPNGLGVRIIDGPRSVGGYTWWQVRTPEGNVGWAVEIAGRERVLVEGTAVVSPTAAPTTTTGLGTPVLLSPLPGTVLTAFPRTVPFSWQAVSGAGRYTLELEVCTSGACEPYLTLSDLTVTTYAQTFPGDGLGRWRVRAFGSGDATTVSDWWSFTIDTSGTVTTPLQISPADGTTFMNYPRTTTLSWQSVSGAVSYEVEIQFCSAGYSGCSSYPIVSSSGTSYTFDFIGAQPGRWRVRAIGSGGTPSEWSPWWTFVYTV